jgi:flagellar protein FlbT
VTRAFHIHLRPGEKIYVNGAVLRTDRKVSLEFLNDVDFLLESHVMQPEATSTPLRQLYFIVQTILMDPSHAGAVLKLFADHYAAVMAVLQSEQLRGGLLPLPALVDNGETFEALKLLRGLFPVEAEVLARSAAPPSHGEQSAKEVASCP